MSSELNLREGLKGTHLVIAPMIATVGGFYMVEMWRLEVLLVET